MLERSDSEFPNAKTRRHRNVENLFPNILNEIYLPVGV